MKRQKKNLSIMDSKGYFSININSFKEMEQKGMTFDHYLCYSISFSSSLFFKEGREKGNRITKVVVKSHSFLLDPSKSHNSRLLDSNINVKLKKCFSFWVYVGAKTHKCTLSQSIK